MIDDAEIREKVDDLPQHFFIELLAREVFRKDVFEEFVLLFDFPHARVDNDADLGGVRGARDDVPSRVLGNEDDILFPIRVFVFFLPVPGFD